MFRDILPKNFIKEVLIEEIGEIIKRHPYLGFSLICLNIEFLGNCLDKDSNWNDMGKAKVHFENAIEILFPKHYKGIKTKLYKELRCGLVHSQLSGSFKLTEVKNAPNGELAYDTHLIQDKSILVIDYFYFDFMQACIKVIAKKFDQEDKMNKGIIRVGPLS